MKKITVVLICSVVCFFCVDLIIGLLCDNALAKIPNEGERFAKSNYFITKCDKDIIIVGSSRAQCNYDPQVIIEATDNTSVFNCGIDAQGFYYEVAALNALLDRYSPKMIIWDFRIDEFENKPIESLNLLYPYYYSNDYIHSFLDDIDSSLKYKMWINAYRYNGLVGRMINMAMSPLKENRLGFGSYSSTNTSINIECQNIDVKKNDIDKKKLILFEQTISRIIDNGINLIIVQSPLFHKYVGQWETERILVQLSDKYNYAYINDSKLPNFVCNIEYIYDINHLNNLGANIFTNYLMKQIK